MPQEHIDLVRGLEAIGRFFEACARTWATTHVAIDELIDAGDRVVALAHHQGAAPGGGRYDVPSITVWTVAGGKLSALYEQLDTLSMARATENAPAAA